MRKLYYLLEKLATVSQQLSYGHYIELLSYDDIYKIRYYIKIAEFNNLSIRQLRDRIKSNECERLDEMRRNQLINEEKQSVMDFVKNPIIIKNKSNYEEISKKVLLKLILEDIVSFMK